MKSLIAALALVATVGFGSAAMAQSAMAGDAMAGDAMAGSAMMATMACRPAHKGETATGKIGAADVVCKKIDMAMMMKGPAMPSGADAAQKAAEAKIYQQFIHDMLNIQT